ncbi:MAG: hypothetical protein NTY38_28230, partial [Acidobacteria bacterium]|nr:hypothetical protein [Acidobacteriota bacterium]
NDKFRAELGDPYSVPDFVKEVGGAALLGADFVAAVRSAIERGDLTGETVGRTEHPAGAEPTAASGAGVEHGKIAPPLLTTRELLSLSADDPHFVRVAHNQKFLAAAPI